MRPSHSTKQPRSADDRRRQQQQQQQPAPGGSAPAIRRSARPIRHPPRAGGMGVPNEPDVE